MARKCPDCGHMNDNEMSFCTECGEPLDPQVRLVMELEGKKAPSSQHSAARNTVRTENTAPSRRRDDDDDDDDYSPLYQEEKKKFSPLLLILILAAAAAAAWFLFFR